MDFSDHPTKITMPDTNEASWPRFNEAGAGDLEPRSPRSAHPLRPALDHWNSENSPLVKIPSTQKDCDVREWRLSREDSDKLISMSREISENLLSGSVERFRSVVNQELARHLGSLGLLSVRDAQLAAASIREVAAAERRRQQLATEGHISEREACKAPQDKGPPETFPSSPPDQTFAARLGKEKASLQQHALPEEPELEPWSTQIAKSVAFEDGAAPAPSTLVSKTASSTSKFRSNSKLSAWDRALHDQEQEDYLNKRQSDAWVKTRDRQLAAWMDQAASMKAHKWYGMCAAFSKRMIAPRSRLASFVHGTTFNLMCCAVLLVNALWMGFEADRGLQTGLSGRPRPAWFQYIEAAFIMVFVSELVTRIVALRWYFVFGEDCVWNVFDSVLVFISFLHILLSSYVRMNVTFVMAIRMFRVVRALRVFRVIRFFHELRYMVVSIIAAGVSMMWSLVLIMLVIYVFSIFFMQCAISHLESENSVDVDTEALVSNYGTIWITMWSLLEAISGGRDWADIVQPMWEIHWTYSLIFLIYIFFMVIGVLNVLVGVFVAAAADTFDKDLEIQSEVMRKNRFVEEMCDLFREFAEEDSLGMITWDRFRAHIEVEEVQAYLSLHQLDTSDAFMLFRLIDRDQTKEVDVTEFIQGCLHLKGTARCSDVAFVLGETDRVKQMMLGFQRQMHIQMQNQHQILAAIAEQQPDLLARLPPSEGEARRWAV